jgi:FkbM family methyltransferase
MTTRSDFRGQTAGKRSGTVEGSVDAVDGRYVSEADKPVGDVRAVALSLVEKLRQAYQLTGWRPTDERFCELGRKFEALHCFPVTMSDGRTLYLDLRNPVSIPYVLEGEFPAERIETMLAEDLVARGDVAVDIGANVGWYASLLCRCVGPEGKVHAFEPNPHCARLLERMARDYPRLSVHAAAAGAEASYLDFYIPDNWISGSVMPAEDGAQRHRVEVCALDERVGPESPDFVKLDAEGAEMAVLAGAKKLLNSADSPIWIVELSTEEAAQFDHDVSEVVEAFEAADVADYTAYAIDQNEPKLSPLSLPESGEFWINALMVPAARAGRIPQRWLTGA